uniref:Uncharacterized protein n=1 Tax=Avena sativa TaxID=4498 RepID=A0ACD5YPQ5_AVESA
MVRPCFGVASPDLHREYHSARPLDFSRQHPIHHGNGFGMPPRGYLDLSRRSPMEHGRERSPPRILEGRRPWTPPPRDGERRWEGLCPERPPRCIEVTPPGTRGRFTEARGLQGPHSWRERTQGSPALSAGLITGRLLHAGDRSSASTFDQRERGGGGGGGGGCGGGTLPRRFVRQKRGIRKAVHESSGSGRQRSQRQGIAADPVKSALVEEKPETQAKIDEASIVGTCGDTQKGFFRLTGPADPSKIRPKAVLVEALKLLQASDRDYNFKTDQLKSIRQDLAVQNIEDEISVQVYEFHARLVLSNGDISELNVCLTKLQQHYQKKLNDHSAEFVAYDILLSAIQGKNIEVMSKLGRLPSSLKQEEAVKHAQTVTQSMRSGNYVQFFKLYKTAPNLNGQLMSLYFEKMRFGALKCMAKAYTQNIPAIYISKILGFHGTQETVAWLQRHGAVTCSGEHGEAFLPKESAPTLAIPDDDVGVSQEYAEH